jgi:uncharacterized protein YecE (DUF72 family)
MMSIKVGYCGFPLGKREYFQKFRLVEIQRIFYKPPPSGTVKRWS